MTYTKLTREQKLNVINEYMTTHTTLRQLGIKYGCCKSTIRKLVKGYEKCPPTYISKYLQRLKEAEKKCLPLSGETFKEHPYYKNIWVSDFGRVINRKLSHPHLKIPTIWKPSPYYSVVINPEHKKVYVHILVAETFLCERPKERTKSGKRPLFTISHKNNNPIDNRPDNLVWETLKDNLRRSPTWVGNLKGENHYASKAYKAKKRRGAQ